MLFYNNTILSETNVAAASNIHWRNNLMLGQNSAPAILSVNTFTSYTSSDYNGFRVNPGAQAAFEWVAPPGVTSDFTGPGHVAKLQPKRFASLTECVSATGQDRHSVAVDYDVFVNVKRLDAQDAASVQKLYKADEFDFRLKPASAAVDKGVALSTVTEGFAGRAPDLETSSSDSRCRTMGPGSSA